MNCFMRSLRPSKAADMLANMVSPPTAGTSLAHRMVAIGGSARNVSSECHTSVPNGGLLSSFLNLMRTGAFSSWGENGCTVNSPKPPAEIDQIVGRDLLIAKDEQLVLDQRVKDHVESLVRQRVDEGQPR